MRRVTSTAAVLAAALGVWLLAAPALALAGGTTAVEPPPPTLALSRVSDLDPAGTAVEATLAGFPADAVVRVATALRGSDAIDRDHALVVLVDASGRGAGTLLVRAPAVVPAEVEVRAEVLPTGPAAAPVAVTFAPGAAGGGWEPRPAAADGEDEPHGADRPRDDEPRRDDLTAEPRDGEPGPTDDSAAAHDGEVPTGSPGSATTGTAVSPVAAPAPVADLGRGGDAAAPDPGRALGATSAATARAARGVTSATTASTTVAPARAVALAASPTLHVSKTTGLNPNGETITVRGSGYDTSKGIYVAVCVRPAPGQPPSPCLGGAATDGGSEMSAWISSSPPSYGRGIAKPYGPGGTFTVTLRVRAADEHIDCRKRQCGIATRVDHVNSADRSMDVFVPLSFAGSGGSSSADGSGSGSSSSGGGGSGSNSSGSGGSSRSTSGGSGTGASGSGSGGPGSGSSPGRLAMTGAASTPVALTAGAAMLALGGGLLGVSRRLATAPSGAAPRRVASRRGGLR